MKFQKFNKIPRLSRDCIITEKIHGTNAQIAIFSGKYFQEYIEDCDSQAIIKPDRVQNQEDVEKFINKYCLYIHPKTSIAIAGSFDPLTNITKPLGYDYQELYIFAGSKKRWLDCSSNGDNYGFAKWTKENASELIKLGQGRHYGEWWGYGIQHGYGLKEKRYSLFNVGKWCEIHPQVISIDPKTKVKKYQNICPKCCKVVPILYKGLFDTQKIEIILNELKQHGSYAVPGFMNPEGIVIFHQASNHLFKKTIENDEKPKGK